MQSNKKMMEIRDNKLSEKTFSEQVTIYNKAMKRTIIIHPVFTKSSKFTVLQWWSNQNWQLVFLDPIPKAMQF